MSFKFGLELESVLGIDEENIRGAKRREREREREREGKIKVNRCEKSVSDAPHRQDASATATTQFVDIENSW